MMDRRAVYAIADTHLGLREEGEDAHTDSPAAVVEFLRWLRGLPKGGGELAEEGQPILVLEQQKVASRRLFPASHLILLGDILELWDGENQDILLSTIPVAATLATVKAEKIYVLGNHDNSMKGPVERHPFGTLNMITEEVYPRPGDPRRRTKIHPLEVGDWSLIFIHGHQLDPLFQLPVVRHIWKVLGYVRHTGAALGLYSYLFLLFALVIGLLQGFLWGWSIPGLLIVAFSVLFAAPRVIMDAARKIYQSRSNRYKRSKILKGTKQWWRKIERRIAEAENLAIVYGHTHLSDSGST